MKSKKILRGFVIITLILIASLICFTPLAFADTGTLKPNAPAHSWNKNKFTKLNLNWEDTKNPGQSFRVVVKTPKTGTGNTKTYKSPTNNIELLKKNDGSIKNNSDKTIKYDLS